VSSDDALIDDWRAEEREPFTGWDFGHLAGRLIEDEPPWSYIDLARQWMRGVSSVLDLGTGGGEVLSALSDAFPKRVVAAEAYPPNVLVAGARLAPLGVTVVPYDATETSAWLPFPDGSFELILSRHEAYDAREVARVLGPGGRFLTQQVTGTSGADLLREFGLSPHWPDVTADRLARDLRDAGLAIEDVRDFRGWQTFREVGALVYWLKAIPWEVPGFSVERHRDVLLRLQRRLEREGRLRFETGRFLIAARR
jgi:SAM-dependent methyltransferase